MINMLRLNLQDTQSARVNESGALGVYMGYVAFQEAKNNRNAQERSQKAGGSMPKVRT